MYRLISISILWLCVGFTSEASPKLGIDVLSFGWVFWNMEVLKGNNNRHAPDAYWHKVELPDSARAALRDNNRVWYRLQIPNTLPPEFRSGVFIDRSLMNLQVYFNDDYLGSGGSVIDPVDRNWNQPHLFRIPSSSWKTDSNILYVQLIGSDGFSTVAPAALVNYTAARADFFKPKQLIRIELSRVSYTVMLTISLFCWLIWYQTRQLLLLFLALASLSWMVVLAYGYFRQFPLEHAAFVRLIHWCIDVCALMLLLFARKKYQYPIQRLSSAVVIYLICLALLLAITPDRLIVDVANSLHIITQLGILYLVGLTAYKYWHSRSASDLSFCIGLVILVALLIHDISLSLSTNWDRWMTDAHVGHLAVPVLFVLLCFSLSNMYKHHLITAEQLNKDLKSRLKQARTDLTKQLEGTEKRAKKQRINAAREHIYRDVHDDLGAKLLSLVYASPEPLKNDLARAALQDLRDVVSRTKTDDIALELLLSATLAEQQQRCEKLNVQLQTNIRGNSHNACYSGHKAVLFKRLIRELVGLFIHNGKVISLQLNIMVGITGVEAAVIGDADESHLDTVSLKARATRINSEIHVLHEHDKQLQVVFWIPHNDSATSPIEGV